MIGCVWPVGELSMALLPVMLTELKMLTPVGRSLELPVCVTAVWVLTSLVTAGARTVHGVVALTTPAFTASAPLRCPRDQQLSSSAEPSRLQELTDG